MPHLDFLLCHSLGERGRCGLNFAWGHAAPGPAEILQFQTHNKSFIFTIFQQGVAQILQIKRKAIQHLACTALRIDAPGRRGVLRWGANVDGK
jgi:hypothetical protein